MAIVDDSLDSTPIRAVHKDARQREFMTRLMSGLPSSKEIDSLLRVGVKYLSFTESVATSLKWIMERYAESRSIPTVDHLQTQFPAFADTALALDKNSPIPTSTLSRLHQNVVDAHYLESLQRHVEKVAVRFSEDVSVADLKMEVEAGYRKLTKITASISSTTKTLSESVDEVLKDFNDSKLGLNWGIPLPFPFLNETLRGLQPAQVMTVLAKPGVGKTWALLQCAATASTGNPWLFTPPERYGKILTKDDHLKFRAARRRVLFISMEMPILDISKRLIALLTKLKYPEIRAGSFGNPADEQTFLNRLNKLKEPKSIGENILMATAQTPDQVAALADEFNADLVIIDGFYLMGGAGEKRWERVQDNSEQIRMHSLTSLRPYILASQLDNKEDRASFSQSIAQDSSIIIKLNQNLQDKNLGQIKIENSKAREGASGLQYYYKWDIGSMTFSEEGQVTVLGRDDG